LLIFINESIKINHWNKTQRLDEFAELNDAGLEKINDRKSQTGNLIDYKGVLKRS
jgi:hypothetical protein